MWQRYSRAATKRVLTVATPTPARIGIPCALARSAKDSAVSAMSPLNQLLHVELMWGTCCHRLQICPILLDLMRSMDKISSLPPNYSPRETIKVG
jgi:hypothetical protein